MSLITSGHFYLGESGDYYFALTGCLIGEGTSIKSVTINTLDLFLVEHAVSYFKKYSKILHKNNINQLLVNFLICVNAENKLNKPVMENLSMLSPLITKCIKDN